VLSLSGPRPAIAADAAGEAPPPGVVSPAPEPVGQVPAGEAPALPETALLLFVSYRGNLPAYPDPTAVRLATAELLADALTERGRRVVTYPEIEPLMRAWRVRSERDLGFGFLGALVSESPVDRLVIATLNVTEDRIVLLARVSSVQTSELQRVEIVEEMSTPEMWTDPAAARADLREVTGRAIAELARRRPPEPPATPPRPGVVLPLRPVGVGRGYADLATHCVLRALLESGQWSIPDPALTVYAVQEAGFDPLLLEPGSRHALAARFSTDVLLVPRLSSFPSAIRTRARTEDETDRELGLSFASGVGVPFHFSLVAVDCARGGLVSGSDVYLAPEKRYGTFGREREIPIVRRFQHGADQLVRQLAAGGRD
jgi:hypothetical protein